MYRRIALFLIAVVLTIGPLSVMAQKLNTGPQVLTFFSNIDDTEQPYGLYLPKHFNTSRKYPLVIMLHGAFSNHRLALRRVFGKSNIDGETDVEATRYFPKWRDIDYIVATPLARGTMGYQGIMEKDVYDVLADVERRFPIDRDRVYLTGLSMGGGGTLWLGLTRPDIWAAIAPVCPAPPLETEEFAQNALDLPVSIHQGGADPVVHPDSTRAWVQCLKDFGTNIVYTEYPGIGHNSWEEAYRDEGIFKWFSKFHRNRFPNRVHFATGRYEYDSAYWVVLDDLTPGVIASIDARFTGVNRVEVHASNLGAFTLNLKGHPKFKSDKQLSITINSKTLTTAGEASITLLSRDSTWMTGAFESSPHSKRKGGEGPIAQAFADRQLYVYGTGGNPSLQMIAARRAVADSVAKWHSSMPLLFFPRVVSDREVRPSDIESSNLILFGTKETNSVINEFSKRLPIDFTGADSSYGLVYVYPAGSHYLLICSGKHWWPEKGNRPPLSTRRGFRFFTGLAEMLVGLGDFVLYKDSLDGVVAEGRFNNDWRLSEADSAKMISTGCVTIKDIER